MLRGDLLRATPAVLVLLGVASLPLLVEDPADRASRYLRALAAAMASGDPAWGLTLARKLQHITGPTPESTYRTGQALLAAGRTTEGLDLIRRIIRETTPPYRPAVVWFARRGVEKESASAEDLAEVETLLREEIERDGDDLEAQELMGRLKVRTGRLESAVAHFQRLAAGSPGHRLRLAQIYERLRRPADAREEAQRARQQILPFLARKPGDIPSRILAIEACRLTGDLRSAVDLAVAGQREHGWQHPVFRGLRSALETSFAMSIMGRGGDQTRQALTTLLEVTRRPDAPMEAFGALAACCRADVTAIGAGKDRLARELATGRNSTVVHGLLGEIAWREGRRDEAVAHFSVAAQAARTDPRLLNNLAWSLALPDAAGSALGGARSGGQQPRDVDLRSALELVEQALRLSPGHPAIRDTRGRILVALGRHRDAIPDLECSMGARLGDPEIRQLLARTYRAAGLDGAARALAVIGPSPSSIPRRGR